MKEKYLSSQKMYHISTGCYCGVVVPLDIMKKAQKILLKAESELKNLLIQNKDKAVSYSWSLSNIMDGDKILKQKKFSYSNFDAWSTIEKRIESLKLAEPQICEEFYIIENQNQLEEIKDDIREELEEELNKEKPNE